MLRATHSLLAEVSTGVLWVLTGTHPCDTSTQAGWWRYQSASSYVRGCVSGVVVHVVVPERVVLWCSAVWFPHSSSNDVACVVVRSRSSSGQHLLDPRLCVFQVSKLIHLQLVQEILGRVNDSSIVLALSLVSLVSHVSENPRALHLWTIPPNEIKMVSKSSKVTFCNVKSCGGLPSSFWVVLRSLPLLPSLLLGGAALCVPSFFGVVLLSPLGGTYLSPPLHGSAVPLFFECYEHVSIKATFFKKRKCGRENCN